MRWIETGILELALEYAVAWGDNSQAILQQATFTPFDCDAGLSPNERNGRMKTQDTTILQ